MSFLKRLRSEERGVAVVVAMGSLLVVSILAFGVAATADRTNRGTIRDSNSKRALSAAEAGASYGRFRIAKAFGTADANNPKCYPENTAAPSSCVWSDWESVGNGDRFRYWVSPVGANCVAAITPPNPVNSRERCVTAVGESNGVRRQVQMRIVENRGAPIFPFPGMLGLDRVALNHSDAVGSVGTNGTLQVGPNSDVRDPGTIKLGGSNWSVTPPTYGVPNRQTSPDPFTLDYFTEWYSESVAAPAAGKNSIGTLSGITVTGTRQVRVAPGLQINLASGRDYNFCSLQMDSDARFVLPASATEPVRIFIDSNNRPGSPNYVNSGCAPFTGDIVNIASGAGFQNDTGRASMLQLYVYGGTGQNVRFNASAAFVGTLWAPQSTVLFNSGATLQGAIAARDIDFRNNDGNAGFTGDNDANNVTGRWDGSYKRSAWRECSAQTGCT